MWLTQRLRQWFCPTPEPTPEAEELLRERLRERCKRFRQLLSANKAALEVMSEIDECLVSLKPFGMAYMHALSTRVTTAVFRMIRNLNVLSDNAYAPLQTAFERISAKMQALQHCKACRLGPLTLPLKSIGVSERSEVGVKMANLGEAATIGLEIPDGFVVTMSAYDRFLEYGGLRSEIESRIQTTSCKSFAALANLAATLQQIIMAADLPPELDAAITEAVTALKARVGSGLSLALRSSATYEDAPGLSFAGQYRSKLNVNPKDACQVYKEIVASKYALTAMSYRYQHGIPDDEVKISVGILAMVPSAAGGVIYSFDPVAATNGQEQILVNAVPGLAQGVVDGAITPDVFVFTRTLPPKLVSKKQPTKSITLNTAQELARLALTLEEYYHEPQDIEWAVNAKTGHLVLLQSRPLRYAQPLEKPILTESQPQETEQPIVSGGIAVSPGVGMGPVFVLSKEADLPAFPEGGLLVVKQALPRLAPLLPHAAGIVSETGGMAGHLASVAREYHLPALFSVPLACSKLTGVGEATLDTERCAVYAGLKAHLLAKRKACQNLMSDSPIHKRLQALAQLVVPLNLLDATSPKFTPEHCQSLHDITRFCHEKAVEFIFETDPLSRTSGKQLKAGGKLKYWIIDLGGGCKPGVTGSVVDIQDITSKTMLALWDGMVAVPWAGPMPSASGFMAVMLESTMNPDLEITAPNAMLAKNFLIISDTYLLLQARYGYHFCTVECLASKQPQENFVNLQFKGGAADRERRHLRACMLAELLEEYGFRADVQEDGLFAVAEDLAASEILHKTRLLGYLLIHTRQVDMIMLEQGKALALREKLAKDMAALQERPWPKQLNL